MLPTTADEAAATLPVPPVGHNRPPKIKRTYGRVACPECGELFTRAQPNAQFCCTEHQAAFHNRSSKRGRVAMPVLCAWRAARNRKEDRVVGKTMFRELCAMADKFNAEDRAENRPSMVDYVRRSMHERDPSAAKEDRAHRVAVRAAKSAPKKESV